jgi:hypothetical protein
MLIYGNTPKDIKKMMFRNKTKVLLFVGAVVIAVALGTGGADADDKVILPKAKTVVEEKTYTPKETLTAFSEVPGKVATTISNEWAETKEYQAKSWAEIKAQWQALKTKLSSK